MNNYRNILLALSVFLFISKPSTAQSISIDEDFSDWENIEVFYEDASGDNVESLIDFTTLKITNDDLYLYLYLDIGTELNLQQDNTISLLLDLDRNPATGESFLGIGYELIFNFGQRNGQFYNPSSDNFNSYEIGLVTSPTVTSSIFEIKIDRDAEINDTKVFTTGSFDFLIRSMTSSGDVLPDNGSGILTYTFSDDISFIPDTYSLEKSDPSDLRVLSYNVLGDNLFNPSAKENFRRIFQTIVPDVIGLQEVYDNSGSEAAVLIEEFLPSEIGQQWFSGDVGNDNLMVSRYPVINQKSLSGNAAYLLDLGNQELLTIVAHPPCCDDDKQRQREVDEFMAFIRDSKAGLEFDIEENTPIVIMGDMNLVGLVEQQNTLITGEIINQETYGNSFSPDWDNTALEDLKPKNPGLPTTFTWYSANSSFSAGRLDYIVYSGSVMEATNGFALHTLEMNADSLLVYGLEKNDVDFASDHLPLVGDFQFKTLTSNEGSPETPANFNLFQNYPNPFNPTTNITFQITNASLVKLAIHDVLGRKMDTLFEGKKGEGNHTFTFDASSFTSGVYYYSLTVDGITTSKKMLLLK